MTAREYLTQVMDAEARIEALAAQMACLARLQMQGERALPAGDEMIRKIAEVKEKLRAEIEGWIAQRRAAQRAIASMEKESHRMLLEYRYLCGWDWRRVALKMHYSLDRMWHLHAEALREFPVPEDAPPAEGGTG